MTHSPSRITAWFVSFGVALAALMGLPRLLGADPTSWPRRLDRPRAVLLGINPLPEEVILKEVSTPSELQSLIPSPAEPKPNVEEARTRATLLPELLSVADADDSDSSQSLLLKLTP